MVGLVLVSHSVTLAAGVQQLIDQMVHGRVPLALAAGTDNADEPIGTDPLRVLQAIETVYSADGVLVLMDLGSALMSAEAAIDLLLPEQQAQIYLCEAPLVEGALAAAVMAATDAPIARVLAEARQAHAAKVAQLAPLLRPAPTEPVPPTPAPKPTKPLVAPNPEARTLLVPNRLGLHARPAARLVDLCSRYDADVTIWRGELWAHGTSINQLITLGARQGDELVVHAHGWEAAAVLSAIVAFFADHLGEDDPPITQPAPTPAATSAPTLGTPLRGTPIAAGIAVGVAVMPTTAPPLIELRPITNVVAEQTRFQVALDRVLRALLVLEEQLASTAAPEAQILAAQRMMLMDPLRLEQVALAIETERWNAEWAWQQVMTEVAARYLALDDPYLRQRVADWRDVSEQLLWTLAGQPPAQPVLTTPGILVLDELLPSVAATLDPTLVLGLVTAQGGATDHSAILARTLGIPAVTGVADLFAYITPGCQMALDGAAGLVWVDPDSTTVATLTAKRTAWLAERTAMQQAAQLPAQMADGTLIQVAANLGEVDEVAAALAQGAAGVGLLRSEFFLMAQPSLPDEEAQLTFYRQVALALAERPLVIRTFDIGGDKPLPQMPLVQEANPFLGWRGLRYCLDNPVLFRPQVRALLRLAAEQTTPDRVKIMFPMVSTLEEVMAVKALVNAEAAQLAAAGYAVAQPLLGIMIETPAAVFQAPQLAQQVDFFSIGTNDLTQYIMAADRGNARVAGLVNHWQPSVLHAIAQVAQAAQAANIAVSVCGEMAADPRAALFFIGIGIRELSMHAGAIPAVKAQIRHTGLAQARAFAQQLLTLTSAAAIEAYLHQADR